MLALPTAFVTSLLLLATNLSDSLVVEGSTDRDHLGLHTRRALRQTARLILPLAA